MICRICQSPHIAAVDQALMAGASVRDIASRFSLSKSGVGRHRVACLQPKISAANRLVAPASEIRREVERAKDIVSGKASASHDEILNLTGILAGLARTLDRLEGAADDAATKKLHLPLAAVSGQLFRGFESAAKIQGMYAEPKVPGTGFSLTINIPAGGTAPGVRGGDVIEHEAVRLVLAEPELPPKPAGHRMPAFELNRSLLGPPLENLAA
jgi:hypothetical protein